MPESTHALECGQLYLLPAFLLLERLDLESKVVEPGDMIPKQNSMHVADFILPP